ncbi:unnamed protein product [Acanthoscelides obtectus]|uniref:Intraflagellar transport protein 46 homolog n=1 Tax=Acanthoscelides obtectus TaxID=200917 RepID=A0A9P0L174_ACAOB|nr:unnamed protein product [Acanthoscelides obtectus]CAK1653928.1 Intraflagellar transport protein 46 homolog [Acanthoscelides obtectus]
MLQRSFSIVEDDDVFTLEKADAKNEKVEALHKSENISDLELSSSEENSNSPIKVGASDLSDLAADKVIEESKKDSTKFERRKSRVSSAGPSGRPRQGSLKKTPSTEEKLPHLSSDSDDSDNDPDKGKFTVPGEYDPKLYENLEVDEEVKDVFQFIQRYIPQQLNLDYKFKPFIPEYLPAVGDIDAFLKVIPPDVTIDGQKFDEKSLNLGLIVLDEPALNQSDSALLHLQLRAASADLSVHKNEKHVVAKKVENVEKNAKVIDKWIKDISDLHKTKSSTFVRYSEPMPDLDDLMQQWPEEMEAKLKAEGFPKPKEGTSLDEYVETVCNIFEIPVLKKKTQSLHLLFCLYAAIKQTQLYQSSASNEKAGGAGYQGKKEADQLVLD